MSEKGRRTKYIVIAVVLVAIIVIGGLVLLTTRKPRYQTDEASQLLAEMNQEIQATSSSWNKISSGLEGFEPIEVTDDPSNLSQGIDYSRKAQGDITQLKSELDSVRTHHAKIDQSLQALQNLQLPDWFSEYIDLMKSVLEKDRERTDKAVELLDNLSLYYGYSEVFLKGMIAYTAMEDNLDDAQAKLTNKDYVGAQAALEKATYQNSEIQKQATEASGIIHFAYLDRVQSNRVEAEQVIQKFTTVIDLVKAGSRAQADQLYSEASQEYDSLKVKRLQPEDLMPEHQSWWSTKVDPILGEVTQLTAEIEVLQGQIDALVKEKKG